MFRQIARQAIQQTKRLSTTNCFVKGTPKVYPRISPRLFHTTFVRFDSKSTTTTPSFQITTLTPERYHRLADEILDHMVEKLEEISDVTDMQGFDVEYSQGVMTISVGKHGTYVINKQPPNHQIWLSSPISGPQRYDYDEKYKKWFYHRDNHTLEQVLNDELSTAFGKKIDLLENFEPQEE
ncbi:hypothetical protein G6F37_011522 [Rhizopus arrhizus]|nr:hypothetical protein G6F38_006925 [Rhizopus arrhizus]KAG1148901.1 hypothetical protein G6F37_011522 [Rhizopus arrhizus]